MSEGPRDGMEGRRVLPGDDIAHAEEFAPGDYAFVEGDHVRSAAVGIVRLDPVERVASVVPFNPVAEVKVGDRLICVIRDVKKALATVDLVRIAGTRRGLAETRTGTIHISKIAPSFTSSAEDELGQLDIVRAVVLQTEPSIQLSTEDADLGVIRALCGDCRSPLVRKGSGDLLHCDECKRDHRRKTASDYGSGLELAEDHENKD